MGVIVIWYIVMHGKISVVIKTAGVRLRYLWFGYEIFFLFGALFPANSSFVEDSSVAGKKSDV